MQQKGQCHCGQVTFTVTGEPLRMASCHCGACRRLSGTGHMSQAFYKKDQVDIRGETKTYRSAADSGEMRTRHFCPNCGSRLFAEHDKRPDTVGIAVGTFDNSDWFKPQVALYTAERPAWDYMDPDLKKADHMT
ncbi:GFA family protein [Maritalea mediterranea]|uniref:GFA family protein n=1 Tax=Maritalea mediterranea TaxID=2909667 RepID=A0ABS9E9A4_9HYPH|nr:GFA family protein [Maritalea mediterranea]MCF4098782.1 GFA family protein [Maritalea mediterranea]